MGKTHVVIRIRGGDPTPNIWHRTHRPAGVPENAAKFPDSDDNLDALKARLGSFDVRYIAYNGGLSITGSTDPIPGIIKDYQQIFQGSGTLPPRNRFKPSGTLTLWGYSLGGRNCAQLATKMFADLNVLADLVALADPGFDGANTETLPERQFPAIRIRNYYQDMLLQRMPWGMNGEDFTGPLSPLSTMTVIENINLTDTDPYYTDYVATHFRNTEQAHYLRLKPEFKAAFDERFGEAIANLHSHAVENADPKCVNDIVGLITSNDK